MSYSTLNFPGSIEGSKTLLTGIRRRKKNTIITGFYETQGNNVSFVKYNEGYYIINYKDYVTNLYGPCFLGHKRFRIVGNFINEQGELIGCYYTGKLDGKGKWNLLRPGRNTICHSTMGDLIVGNTEEGELSTAFIYDICSDKYINIKKKDSKSVTAYGIWHNEGHSYTICGGYSPILGSVTDIGYTVNYNSKTRKFSNWKDYYYNDDTVMSIVTHFDGITGSECGGYNLTGVAISTVNNPVEVGFFLKTKKHGSKNIWKEVKYPNSIITTGNSVVGDTVIGVYTVEGQSTVNGYIAEL